MSISKVKKKEKEDSYIRRWLPFSFPLFFKTKITYCETWKEITVKHVCISLPSLSQNTKSTTDDEKRKTKQNKTSQRFHTYT